MTLRCVEDVPRLWSGKMAGAIRGAMMRVQGFAGFRVQHVSIQHNHLHLIIEAEDSNARSRGLGSLEIAIAKAINRACGRRGAMFAFRYHAVALTTPKQVRHTIGYVLGNWRHHHEDRMSAAARRAIFDPYSSSAAFDGWDRAYDSSVHVGLPVECPTSWLLAVGWRQYGPIDPDATPKPDASRHRR
ncbi:MAG TPA: hypothetical protein VHZ95_13880 [Polyangiales bacterium]|nr:hypothetical protein [Polyangiales bacterium]